ncbi:multidrug effflux MFS transporter [Chryseobacterium koreense]
MGNTSNNQVITNHKSNWFLLSLLGALMAFTSLSTDVYLPALPQMQTDLKGNVELTITGFLIGFAVAQIFWGPFSDRFGRKMPLILGLLLFIIGSVGCALSQNIFQMIFCRVIQAFGACVGPMLARAMVRDMYGRTKAAETLSTLMLIMAVAPIIGPLIGGQLIKISSWHSIFWFLSIMGGLILLATYWLKETLPITNRTNASIASAFSKYPVLLKNRKFMRYTLCVTFYYVGAYAFIAGSPFVYITYYGIEPQHYGWLFAFNIVGLMLISFLNRILVKRFSLDALLRVATKTAMVAALILAIDAKWNIGGIYGIVIPVFVFFSMNGIIAATSTAAALDGVPEMAGAASALLGSLQYGSGIISTVLLAWLSDGTGWTMAWIMAFSAIAAVITISFKKVKTKSVKMV